LIPDCDLRSPLAQDLRGAGGDGCGVMSNTRFGTNVLSNNFDPSVLGGWGNRSSDWTFRMSLDHQLFPRTAVNLSYVRRWFNGFSVADNVLLEPSDLTRFRISAPVDPRLPAGGGYIVDGLYDVSPEKAGQLSNLIAPSSSYGRWYQYFNGLDVTVAARGAAGLNVMMGLSSGQTVADNCDVRARVPELSTATIGTTTFGPGLNNSAVTPVSPYCHVAFGVLTQFKGLAAYLVPRFGLEIGAAIQNKPGPMLVANYAVPNADTTASLGRNLSGNAPNVTVNLVEPGTMYGARLNQLDVRLAKALGRRRPRTVVGADIYNALNSGTPVAYNSTFVPGGTWPQPLTIITPRLIRVTLETRF
jgi:hypothetical protein